MSDVAATLNSVHIMAMLEAGTHVLMPVKDTPEMRDAIERYFFSRVANKGAELKDNERRDRIFAQCWQALMAHHAIVDLFKNAGKP